MNSQQEENPHRHSILNIVYERYPSPVAPSTRPSVSPSVRAGHVYPLRDMIRTANGILETKEKTKHCAIPSSHGLLCTFVYLEPPSLHGHDNENFVYRSLLSLFSTDT